MTLDFIKSIVQQIVIHPEDVVITRTTDTLGVLYTIKTNPLDSGILIGRQGATIGALRLIARIVGYKEKEKVSIKFDDPRKRV